MAIPIPFIYIGGRFIPEAKVRTLTLTSGLRKPSTAIIALPNTDFFKMNFKRGMTVKIKTDNIYEFEGIVSNRVAIQSTATNTVYYECVGLEYIFNAVVCYRNYNSNEEPYAQDEYFTSKYIVYDMFNYVNHVSNTAHLLNDSGLSTVFAGEQLVKGMPIADAIEALAAIGSNGAKARIAKKYLGNGRMQVTLFYKNFGRYKPIRFGTRPELCWNAQPQGTPTVTDFTETLQVGSFCNRVIVEGDYRKIQHTVTLQRRWANKAGSSHYNVETAAWETDDDYEQTIMKGRELYTTSDWAGYKNPYYDVEADRVGRHYFIPKIKLFNYIKDNYDGTKTGGYKYFRAKIDKYLVQDDIVMGYKSKDTMTSFLLYRWAGETEGEYHVANGGYTIENDELVILNRPLVKLTWDEAGQTYDYVFPEEVKLTCTFQDSVRVTYDSGKIGSEPYTITRYIQEPNFKWEQIYNGYKMGTDKAVTLVAQEDFRRDNVSKTGGDSPMKLYARKFLNEFNTTPRAYEVTIPFINLDYNVGDVVNSPYSNINGLNIIEVIRDYWISEKLAECYITRLRIAGGE